MRTDIKGVVNEGHWKAMASSFLDAQRSEAPPDRLGRWRPELSPGNAVLALIQRADVRALQLFAAGSALRGQRGECDFVRGGLAFLEGGR